MNIIKLKEERNTLLEKANEILEVAGKEIRALTEDENKHFDEIRTQIDAYTNTINKAEALEKPELTRSIELDVEDRDSTSDDFRNYLIKGETRGLVAGTDASGGYVAPEKFYETVYENAFNPFMIQSLVNVVKIKGNGSVGVPYIDTDASDADWTIEVPASDITADSTLAFGKKTLEPISLAKYFTASKQFLNKAAINVDSFVAERIGRKLSKAIENAILNGTGTAQPLGIFDTTTGVASVSASQVSTGSATSINTNALIEALTEVEKYGLQNLTWVFHPDVLAAIRKLKGTDRYELWTPELNGRKTLLGVPYVLSDLAPNTFTTGLPLAVIGDFSKYMFTVSNDVELTRLNEVAALKNSVGFLGYMEGDGTPILSDAFRVIMTA